MSFGTCNFSEKWKVHEAHYMCINLIMKLCNGYTMGCPPVHGDNPQALASGLSSVLVDKHDVTILYHLHQYRPCTSQDFMLKGGIITDIYIKLMWLVLEALITQPTWSDQHV